MRLAPLEISSSSPFATVSGLGVTYATGVQAVADLAFALKPGEFVSLIGPSGCGKSTVLKVLAGLLPASAGIVCVGQQSALPRGATSDLAFVFQHPTLLGWRSVAANVRLPLELSSALPPSDIPSRVRDVLTWVGLAEFANAFPPELSGGMQMRVSIARALVTRPSLLLMDEPFAALDDLTRQRLNEDLVGLWQRDRWNALFVTHNVAEAVFLSQRVLVMSSRPGRIVADISIPLPYPRERALRTSPEFVALLAQVTAALSSSERIPLSRPDFRSSPGTG